MNLDLGGILFRIRIAKKKIAAIVILLIVVTAGILFLIQNQYTAETSILPELEKNKMLGLMTSLDLTAATGLNLGETPVSKLYPMIIKSERVLREVILHLYAIPERNDSLNLIRYWELEKKSEVENFEIALKKLRNKMDVTFDARLGTLMVKVEMEDPQLAADVANQVTEQLDIYTRTRRKTGVTLQREFIEKRIHEIQITLEGAEDSLAEFRKTNRRISDSPELVLHEDRLQRDVQINSTVYLELKKQIELAKIEEVKNIPIINILDVARKPLKKSYPTRGLYLVLATLAYVVGTAAFFGFQPDIQRSIAELQRMLAPSGSEKL